MTVHGLGANQNNLTSNELRSAPKVFNTIPLPREILHKYIFPLLNDETLDAVAKTSIQSQNEVRSYSINTHCTPTLYFASFVGKELKLVEKEKFEQLAEKNLLSNIENSNSKLYANEIENLMNLQTHISNNVFNLIEIQQTLPQLKREILNILKNIHDEDLSLLKPSIDGYLLHKNLPQFKDLFKEISCYKDLKFAQDKPKGLKRVEALISSSNQFLVLGDRDKAIEILNEALETARVMSKSSEKNRALMQISSEFLEKGDPAKALEIAQTMSDGNWKNLVIMNVLNKFIELKDPVKALETTKAMSAGRVYLVLICDLFLDLGDLDQALEVAQEIPGFEKDQIFMQISSEFLKKGDPVKALEIARTISISDLRKQALMQISGRVQI